MANNLDRQVKTALNETRLLILGVQVLLGFQFQSFFQDAFERLSLISKALSLGALALFFLCASLLIAPSMQHRFVDRGYSSDRLLRTAGGFATVALGVLAPALGLCVYVVVGLHFGDRPGAVAAGAVTSLALLAWYGLGLWMGVAMAKNRQTIADTPLSTRIEQLLMEARIIIPGAQALLGFQLTVMLTNAFAQLDEPTKIVHAVALGLIAINIVLLMTPAALHRLSFAGEDSERFLTIGSALVIAAPAFLAAGVAADIYVVFLKVLASGMAATAAALVAFFAAVTLWYLLPMTVRRARER